MGFSTQTRADVLVSGKGVVARGQCGAVYSEEGVFALEKGVVALAMDSCCCIIRGGVFADD